MNYSLSSRLEKSLLIKEAFEFAQKAHAGQKRLSGGPYFEHVKKTAEVVANWGLDEPTITAALLHDTVEDTKITLEEINKRFGPEVAFLIDGVTKLGKIKYRGAVADMENMRKFILAVSKDIRVILIKLADRLNNMQTLSALPPVKQKRIALETMEIYAPLAYQLGMFEISGELDDLSFAYLYPKELKWLINNVRERYQEREEYAKRVKPIIQKELRSNGIEVLQINTRAKRYASLWRKLQKHEMNLDRIYDLVAIRCILKTIEDCYIALGIIHNKWTPLPGRFKDYIALPKTNGYQSLHTTIFGPEKKIVEVQIRTEAIHQEAEYGIAAYWHYQQAKNLTYYPNNKTIFTNRKDLLWIKKLRDWQKNLHNPNEFMQSLKIDFLGNQILVLTPKGRVIKLPKDSTVIDFAYKVHTEVGNSCTGALINGNKAPLNQSLHSGDVVAVMTQKNKGPSLEWLSFIKTNLAKNQIKLFFKKKNQRLIISSFNKLDLKIIVEDRIGILKDITGIISQQRINISDHQSQLLNLNNKLHLIKIGCTVNDKNKALRLVEKIKKVSGVKKLDYHLV